MEQEFFDNSEVAKLMNETVVAVGETAQAVEALVPFIKEPRPLQGKATAYVCKNYVCNLPTTDLAKLAALLDASP